MKRFLILCAMLVGLIVAANYASRNEVDRLQQHFRTAGVFPHNHDFEDRRAPYFRDEHGLAAAEAARIQPTYGPIGTYGGTRIGVNLRL